MNKIFSDICLLFVLLVNSLSATAGQAEQEEVLNFKLSGFVKTDYWYDSRSVLSAREDLFLLYPLPESYDQEGFDIHSEPSFNFSAITSRITGTITGPDFLNARTSGMIEADFSGVTNADINGFRLRHAYLKLQWEKAELLMGQWWHPLFGIQALPTVVSLNTGAPFQPFIRNPQISFTYRHGNLQTILAAIAQRDNASDGPQGTSPEYLRNSTMPNIHLQFIYSRNNTTAGFATDYKKLRPRMLTDSLFRTTETISTYAFMGYVRQQAGMWGLKAKAIYGQNLSEHLLMGGYAESSIDPDRGHITYTPLTHLMTWGNVTYGNTLKAGLFVGYAQNLGAGDTVNGQYYGRGHDIAYLYRLAPSINFKAGKVQLSTELEYTAAAYGTPDSKGVVKNTSEVANLRLLFTAFYFF